MTRCKISAGIDSMISLAGMTVTATKERYVEMIQIIFLKDSPNNSNDSVFMQDGEPTRTSKMAMEWLKDRFPEKLIWLKSEFIWPPRSPYLNPLHFYLWGYMKE